MTIIINEKEYKPNLLKVAFVAFLVFYAFKGIEGTKLYIENFESKGFFILDDIDLAFHEFGHPFFGLLGIEFLTIAGGTIMQLMIPTIIGCYFFIKKEFMGLCFAIYWLGVNFIDVSVYAGDATALRLPLLTGGTGADNPYSHDWNNMLSTLDLLQYDTQISRVIYGLGILCFIISIVIGIWFSFEEV